jgi:subtilisin family serine protease
MKRGQIGYVKLSPLQPDKDLRTFAESCLAKSAYVCSGFRHHLTVSVMLHTFSKTALSILTICAVVSCSTDPSAIEPMQDGKGTATILAAPKGASKIPDHYVIVFDESQVDQNEVGAEVKRLEKAHGLTVGYIYESAIRGFSAKLPPGILKKLEGDKAIKRIEEDYEITVGPVDQQAKPGGGGSTYARVSPQQLPWGVDVVGHLSGVGTRAWIIDSGIDDKHPDLTVNKTLSKNFVTGSRASAWQDKNGHGTHVAGTIGAKDDGFDAIGVAPGADLVAVRCLDSRGSGQYSWIIAGVDHISANAAAGDVCNMSLGGPAYSALDESIRNAAAKNIIFVLAAGNDGVDCSTSSPARVGYNNPNVWTVSAHTIANVFASWSNYGLPVDICAPGVTITSTRMGGGLTTMSGTSMAAPHVAGILLVANVGSRGTVTGDKDAVIDNMAKMVE